MKSTILIILTCLVFSCKTKEKMNIEATETIGKLIECIKNNDKKKFMKLQYFSNDNTFTDFEDLHFNYQNSLIKDKELKINLQDTIDGVFGNLKFVKFQYSINPNPLAAIKSTNWIIYFDDKKGYEKIQKYELECIFSKK